MQPGATWDRKPHPDLCGANPAHRLPAPAGVSKKPAIRVSGTRNKQALRLIALTTPALTDVDRDSTRRLMLCKCGFDSRSHLCLLTRRLARETGGTVPLLRCCPPRGGMVQRQDGAPPVSRTPSSSRRRAAPIFVAQRQSNGLVSRLVRVRIPPKIRPGGVG